jgi:hypothetical protein
VAVSRLDTMVNVVASAYLDHKQAHKKLIAEYDLGFPLAASLVLGGVEKVGGLTAIGASWIEMAYFAILDMYGLDYDGDYGSLEAILAIANGRDPGC